MPTEDSLSSRFDYLFEPLDDEKSADGTVDAESAASDPSDDNKPSGSAAPVWMAFAAFELATLGARPPFPNQGPQRGGGGSDDDGGLLGGGLPGPL